MKKQLYFGYIANSGGIIDPAKPVARTRLWMCRATPGQRS
jgi:hypothetical protein